MATYQIDHYIQFLYITIANHVKHHLMMKSTTMILTYIRSVCDRCDIDEILLHFYLCSQDGSVLLITFVKLIKLDLVYNQFMCTRWEKQ